MNSGVVHCRAVTRIDRTSRPPSVIFAAMTVTIPGNRLCAILGPRQSGRSTLLRLLAGLERPDAGDVLTKCRFSPIANAKSYFHPQQTGLENLTAMARLHGMNERHLAEVALSLPCPGADWAVPAGELPAKIRGAMELLLSALLPFNNYLIDNLGQLDPAALDCFLQLLEIREAGLIFTTQNPQVVRRHADWVGVIANQTVYGFESVEEALEFNDSQPGQ